MNLSELLDQLKYEEEIFLVESGSPQKLRHYTNMMGLSAILKSGYIRRGIYYFGGRGISVARPTTHTLDFNDKTYCGYFEIDFDILNDKIRNIKKYPINELEIQYETFLQDIAKKYNMAKESFHEIQNLLFDKTFTPKEFQKMMAVEYGYNFIEKDCERFISYYEKMIRSLYYREGEERIKGNDIPIHSKYMKFYELDNFYDDFDSLSEKGRYDIQNRIEQYKDIFVNYDKISTHFIELKKIWRM